MVNSFIKNKEMLEEKVSDEDHLDISKSVETLSNKIISLKGSNIVGIVGEFGIGKSTLISQTEKFITEKQDWIYFDAWQFPERKELWEGLILETANTQGKLDLQLEIIEGKNKEDLKTLINTIGDIPLPGLSVIKNLNYFIKTSPATRVFQLQKLFKGLIEEFECDKVIFVIEDTDRSGQDGLFFLETIKQFLLKNTFTKEVLFICPISKSYWYDKNDVYLKCFDYVEFFNKSRDSKLKIFLEEILIDDCEDKEIIIQFFEYIYNKSQDINMRKLKMILRQGEMDFQNLIRLNFKPNILICLVLAASKYIQIGKGNSSMFDNFVTNKKIESGNEFNRAILISNKSYRNAYNSNFFMDLDGNLLNTQTLDIVENNNSSSIPYFINSFNSLDDKNKHCINNFYFKEI